MKRIAKWQGSGLLVVALVAGLGAALAASAQPFGPGGPGAPGGPGGQAGPFLRALRGGLATVDLSDEQKDKIRGILEAKKEAGAALAQKLRTDGKVLRDLANAATPDPTAVGKAFLTLKEDREAAKRMAEGVLADVKAVLTAEQATKLDGYLAALKQMRRGRAGRG